MVKLMAHTTTAPERRVAAALAPPSSPPGPKVADAALAQVHCSPAACHGHEWTDLINPHHKHP